MYSYWEKVFYKSDIAIIGAGISGLSMANALIEKSPHLSISVIEKDTVPSAASTRNAGFACFGSFTELISDKKKMGTEQMLSLVEKRWKGLHLLRNRVGDKNMHYQDFGGYEILKEDQLHTLNELDDINADLKEIFNQSVFELKNDRISKFNFSKDWCKALLFNPLEGQVHSGLMVKKLRDLTMSKGIQIHSGVEIVDFNEDNNLVKLQSSAGHVFKTGKAIFCNNAYSKKLFPDEDIHPGRGLVMLSKEMEMPFSGSFHIDEGFYYFRDVGKRMLIGGGRNEDFDEEKTFEKGINPKIKKAIIKKTELILNGKPFHEDMCWSGIMAFGDKKNPIIKKVSPNIRMAVRLSGMGVALASQLAEEISNEVLAEI